ncbi:hypothetical protein BH09MYX1_BH09MYX1_44430 [soil metagenome]
MIAVNESETQIPVSQTELPEVPVDDEDYNLPFTD